MNYLIQKKVRIIFVYSALILIVFVFFSPYLWLVSASLKTRLQIFSIPPVWVFKPTTAHYLKVFIEKGFWRHLANSCIISLSTTFLSLAIAVFSAYAFARCMIRGDRFLFFYLLLTRIAPPITLSLPLYLLMNKFHLLNTFTAPILAHTTFNLGLAVWILTGFFRMVPKEIEEAAVVDGCSITQVFLYISLPLVASGLVTVAIFCIINSWNEFLYVLILTGKQTAPLTAAIPGLITSRGTYWGQIAAVGVIGTLPILFFSFLVQKRMVKGLTFGAIRE